MWRNEHWGAQPSPRPGSRSFQQHWPVGPSTFFPTAWPSLQAEQPMCLDLEADGTGPLPDPGLLSPSTLGGHPLGISGVCKGSSGSDVGAGITSTLSPWHQPVRPTSGKLRQESVEGGKDGSILGETRCHMRGSCLHLAGEEQLQGHGVCGKQSERKPKVLGSQQGCPSH